MAFWGSRTIEEPQVAPEPQAPGRFDVDDYFPQSPPPDQPPPRPRWWRRWRWRRILAALLLLFASLFIWLAITAPLSKSLKPIVPPAITLLSSDGDPIARRGAITDQPVDVTTLPAHVPGAFVAIEDRRFYSHLGIDPKGIVRAAVNNAMAGGVRQGGSTITQQLAKLAFLNADQTAARKLREMMIAFWLEAWLSKEEILSRYLSSAYFGDNVYGLRAASKHYFSRDPEDLRPEQAALLAGLLKAPSRLAPTSNMKGARDRSKLVIAAMIDSGVLTAAEARALRPVKLKVSRAGSMPTGTYFADWVFPSARALTEDDYGEQRVTTTLDDDLQRAAVRAVRRAGLGSAQVAIVAMRPDGRVVAMVGGKDYKKSAFNRATQARRQPGSTFKLFVYLAAMRAGADPDDIILDEPFSVGSWSPRNSDGRYRGSVTLRQAFAASSNVAAVRLSEQVGRDKVIEAARDLGVTSPLTTEPSLALGTSGVSLMEMTAAYAAVASGRYPVRPRGLPADQRSWYEALTDRGGSLKRRDVQDKMLDLLHSAVSSGTGRAASLRTDVFGKTGTSQDNRDAIFIGFARDLVVGVWVGKDDNSPLSGVHGGGLPARIWRDFMRQAVEPSAPAPPRPKQIESGGDDAITLPIDELGIDLGAEFGPDGAVTISAEPQGAPDAPPGPNDEVLRVTLPPPSPPREEAAPPE